MISLGFEVTGLSGISAPAFALGSILSWLYDRDVPIYEFECGECGERFEELVAAGTEVARCPACGAQGAPRILSTFSSGRLPTANQRRRMEDKRGVNRDGARQRFKQGLARARQGRKGSGS